MRRTFFQKGRTRRPSFVLLPILLAAVFLLLGTAERAQADYDLMIICPESYVAALEALVDHKALIGVSAAIQGT